MDELWYSGIYYGYYGGNYGTKWRSSAVSVSLPAAAVLPSVCHYRLPYCTAVDVPVTWCYVYCISTSSAFMALKRRRAVRMQLNADVELSFLATRHVVKWRPTAATVPPNFYLGSVTFGYFISTFFCLL